MNLKEEIKYWAGLFGYLFAIIIFSMCNGYLAALWFGKEWFGAGFLVSLTIIGFISLVSEMIKEDDKNGEGTKESSNI